MAYYHLLISTPTCLGPDASAGSWPRGPAALDLEAASLLCCSHSVAAHSQLYLPLSVAVSAYIHLSVPSNHATLFLWHQTALLILPSTNVRDTKAIRHHCFFFCLFLIPEITPELKGIHKLTWLQTSVLSLSNKSINARGKPKQPISFQCFYPFKQFLNLSSVFFPPPRSETWRKTETFHCDN